MTIALCAGGTGGHIYPAIAVAQGCEPDQILFIGSTERLECELVKSAGFPFHGFSIPRARPWVWARSIMQMVQFFSQRRISALICFGGYVCFPACVAARLLDIPILLHEQNKIMGRLNRLMAPWVAGVGLSFADTAYAEHLAQARVVGCPVREEFQNAKCKMQNANLWNPSVGRMIRSNHPKDSLIGHFAFCTLHFSLKEGLPTLVVLGGSQGAQFLNDWVSHLVKNPPNTSGQIFLSTGVKAWKKFLQSVGVTNLEVESWVYEHNAFRIVAQPYVHDMPALLSCAQAFVARAGASSLAEMAVMGIPGVVVPYPFAMDKHQDSNAAVYAESGAVVVLAQANLSNDHLWEAVQKVWLDENRRGQMAAAMATMTSANVVKDILDWVRQVS